MSPYVAPGVAMVVGEVRLKRNRSKFQSYDLRGGEVVGVNTLRLCDVPHGSIIKHLGFEFKVEVTGGKILVCRMDPRYTDKEYPERRTAQQFGLKCKMWVEVLTLESESAELSRIPRPAAIYSNKSPFGLASSKVMEGE